MKKISLSVFILVLLLSVATSSLAANLSGEEIKQTLSGKTIEWVSLKEKRMSPNWSPPYGSTYFLADGRMEGRFNSKNDRGSRTGTWHVKKDQLCMNWKKEKCYQLQSDGSDGYYLVHFKKGKKGIHFKSVVDGKHL